MAFRRRWFGLGRLRSDEGFTLSYAQRSVNYSDARGTFQFGFEDGFLFPEQFQTAGDPIELTLSEREEILKRVIDGLRFDGHDAKIFGSD